MPKVTARVSARSSEATAPCMLILRQERTSHINQGLQQIEKAKVEAGEQRS